MLVFEVERSIGLPLVLTTSCSLVEVEVNLGVLGML
jgi:hypothetical protein